MSINCLDEKTSRILEPLASPPKERIKTLKEAKNFGIKVYGFISPVFPGITNLEDLFRELSFCEYVWVELLNIKPSVLKRLMPVIKKEFPEKINDFEFMINNYDEYCKTIKAEVNKLSNKYHLKVMDIVVH
jgi:DNA repair photolyase